MWQNSTTQIATTPKNSNCDKTQKLKLWLNSTTKIVKILKNSISDKTQTLKLRHNSIYDTILKSLLVRATWHLHSQLYLFWAAFCNLAMFSLYLGLSIYSCLRMQKGRLSTATRNLYLLNRKGIGVVGSFRLIYQKARQNTLDYNV